MRALVGAGLVVVLVLMLYSITLTFHMKNVFDSASLPDVQDALPLQQKGGPVFISAPESSSSQQQTKIATPEAAERTTTKAPEKTTTPETKAAPPASSLETTTLDQEELYKQRFCQFQNTPIWDSVLSQGAITPELAEKLLKQVLVPLLQTPRADFEQLTPPGLPPIMPCNVNPLGPSRGKQNDFIVADAIILGFELDLMEVRMMELYDVVDFFFITESRHTHSGLNKPLLFAQNMDRFSRFMDKIVYVPLTDAEERQFYLRRKDRLGQDQDWGLENHARVYIMDKIAHTLPNQDGFVISGDVDEIPNRLTILQARQCSWNMDSICTSSIFYQYSPKWAFQSDFPAYPEPYTLRFPTLIPLRTIRGTKDVRVFRQHSHPGPCAGQNTHGAHMTYFGGLPQIVNKAITVVETGATRSRQYAEMVATRARKLDDFHTELMQTRAGIHPQWVGRIVPASSMYQKPYVPWAVTANPKRFATLLGNFVKCGPYKQEEKGSSWRF